MHVQTSHLSGAGVSARVSPRAAKEQMADGQCACVRAWSKGAHMFLSVAEHLHSTCLVWLHI